MLSSTRFRAFCRQTNQWYSSLPRFPRDLTVTVLLLSAAFYASSILIAHTGGENNSALVFVLAVTGVSFLTAGYLWGILASFVGTVLINTYFMFPYAVFSLSQTGYPVAMLSMATISCVVCFLTSRVKQQAAEAVRREKNTKSLYEQNQKLNEEKAAIELQSARETIHSNILRAVSHDLRTPLTSISGAASVLLSSQDLSERNLSMVTDIKNDADALIVMVENLLSVTRIQDGSFPLKKREEMLEEVAGDAILTIRRRFPNNQVELLLSEDILYLPMEPVLIKQVMVNLRHSGSPEPIVLHLFREDDVAAVEVRDRGRGLTPEVLQAVQSGKFLNRDRSGDSTRGMGIGLSVCQSIVKAHDGTFTAGNNPEGGAFFRFTLPMEVTTNE